MRRLPLHFMLSISTLSVCWNECQLMFSLAKENTEQPSFIVSSTKLEFTGNAAHEYNASRNALTMIRHNYTFHSWGAEGIEFDPILHFMHHTYHNYNETEASNWYKRLYGPFPAFVVLTNESSGVPKIYIPKKIIRRRLYGDVTKRLSLMLPYFQRALRELLPRDTRFHRIVNVLKQAGSFPILFQLDDYRGCLFHNYNMSATEQKSLPYMTLCRQAGCNYAFPIPGYRTFRYANMPTSSGYSSWKSLFDMWKEKYPSMENKIPKASWRGSCNSGDGNHRTDFLRKSLDPQGRRYLDVARTSAGRCPQNVTLPALVNITPPEYSMHYRAVLDIDGNSWSERFPRLLCYNSVVIRVSLEEEDHDEYYFTPPTLLPGVHFLSADLNNFTQVAQWAVNDKNLMAIRKIVENANMWCQETLNTTRLAYDFLTVLQGVVEGLNANDDAKWVDKWNRVQGDYLGPRSWNGHGGFTDRVWPKTLLDAAPGDENGLAITKLV